jgi:hypothetical protein
MARIHDTDVQERVREDICSISTSLCLCQELHFECDADHCIEEGVFGKVYSATWARAHHIQQHFFVDGSEWPGI